MENDVYTLNTDGCCLGNPGAGGVGVNIFFPETLNLRDEKFYRGFHQTTNNRMGLKAGIEGLKLIRKRIKELDCHKRIVWLTDSQYVAENMYQIPVWRKSHWKRANGEPILNEDLWRELEGVRNSLRIYPTWIPREKNSVADKLAKQGAGNPGYTDSGYNPGRVGSSIGESKRAPTFFEESRDGLCIRIYKGDGQISKSDSSCKIRFQTIEEDGQIKDNKYYIYTTVDIYTKLHRAHKYIVKTTEGNIIQLVREI